MSTVETATPKAVKLRPFGIEADHPRNCDLVIQAIPGCRLRGAVKANRAVNDSKTGQPMIPVDQSRHLATLPEIPGMQLHVDPSNLSYAINDPLYNNAEVCERIRRGLMQSQVFRSETKIQGVKPMQGQLDSHRMKTLIRELRNIVNAGEARLVVGTIPDEDTNDAMPGEYLLNPGSLVQNQQPRFERDWDEWLEQLTKSGG